MLSEKDLKELCNTASAAAIVAGDFIQSQFGQQHEVKQKSAGCSLASQVVTAVDFKAQEIILKKLEGISKQYDLGLLTEEASDNQSRHHKAYFWCVDPMDGTLAFAEGRTGYAVSIALVNRAGNPVIGVVYVPDLQNCYTAIAGAGVFLNHRPYNPKPTKKVGSCIFYMDTSIKKAPYYEWLKQQLRDYANERKNTLEFHFGFGAVRNALGVMQADLGAYFKFPKQALGGGSIWDYAATRLFFEELGLCVTNIEGEALKLNHQNTFMNEGGILFSNDRALSAFIMSLGQQLIKG